MLEPTIQDVARAPGDAGWPTPGASVVPPIPSAAPAHQPPEAAGPGQVRLKVPRVYVMGDVPRPLTWH